MPARVKDVGVAGAGPAREGGAVSPDVARLRDVSKSAKSYLLAGAVTEYVMANRWAAVCEAFSRKTGLQQQPKGQVPTISGVEVTSFSADSVTVKVRLHLSDMDNYGMPVVGGASASIPLEIEGADLSTLVKLLEKIERNAGLQTDAVTAG